MAAAQGYDEGDMNVHDITRHLATLTPRRADYRGLRTSWRKDLMAGLTVGIVALPLALAFGVSSGVGAEAGLITAVIAGIVGAIFGGSPVQVSGPTGAMVVVLVPLVAAHGPGSVIVVGTLAGFVLIIASMFKFGRLIGFIPWPVIEGFTVGIAAIIFLQQVPSALATKASTSTNTAFATVETIANVDWQSAQVGPAIVIVGAVAIVMTVLPRITRAIPGSIIAIILTTAAVEILGVDVPCIGALPSSLPPPHFPDISLGVIAELTPSIFAIAVLAGIESLLSARVASTLSGNTLYEPDRELFGQGLASIAACAFGGMPATGAIARTAVNVKSGGTTRFASIIHGIFLLAVIYVGTQLVSQIPLAALAGVLMVTAIRMFPVTAAKEIIRSTKSDALVFVATALITVAFDLIDAVIIGVAATAFFSLRALVRTSGIHREEVPLPPQPEDRHIAIFRLDGALFFGAADSLIERLRYIDDVRVAIVRMSGLQFLDATGAHVLVEISTALERRGVHVVLKGIRAEHRVLLDQLGLPKLVDVTATLDEALAQARARVARDSTR